MQASTSTTDTELLERERPAVPRAGFAPERERAGPRQAVPDRRAGRPSVSVVIPARNEAANLQILLSELAAQLPDLAGRWEVVVVDDGSSDGTGELLAAWTRTPGFCSIELSRNFGKEAALTAGLRCACGEVVVTMDADLQHPPALLEEMLERWRQGADIVYAARANRRDESALKRLGSRTFYRLINAFEGFEVPPDAGDFRLMDRTVVDALNALPERNRFMKGLYAWVGFRAVALPYEPMRRRHGRSHFGYRRLARLSVDGLTAFTTWPLRVATVIGLAVALAALGYGSWLTLSYWLWGHPVSGWTTIVVGLAALLGVQMVLLGIVGEYIGRIFNEVKARPLFVVRRVRGEGLARG